jgi:hypothetical protein
MRSRISYVLQICFSFLNSGNVSMDGDQPLSVFLAEKPREYAGPVRGLVALVSNCCFKSIGVVISVTFPCV